MDDAFRRATTSSFVTVARLSSTRPSLVGLLSRASTPVHVRHHLVDIRKRLTHVTNKKSALLARTSPLALAPAGKTRRSRMSDAPRIVSPVVRYAVHSCHAVSIRAINRVIDRASANRALKYAGNRNASVDIHALRNVTPRLDVRRRILANTSSLRPAHAVTCNHVPRAEPRSTLRPARRHNSSVIRNVRSSSETPDWPMR